MKGSMRLTRIVALLVCPLLVWAASGAALAYAQAAGTASAQLIDKTGKPVGTALFEETGSGALRVRVQLHGLEGVAAGEHGIHVHQTAQCEAPDFSSAGEHFNPTAKGHGKGNPDGPHVSDLPNITTNADGTADYEATNILMTISPGETSIFDTDGSALIIHENPDDYMTDPSGKSGGRIICGILVPEGVIVGMPRTGAETGAMLLWLALAGATLTAMGAVFVRARRQEVKAEARIRES